MTSRTFRLPFPARLAWRELRAGVGGFRAFLIALALGVGMTSAAASLTAGLVAGLEKEGRAILGGDFEARASQREASQPAQEFLQKRAAAFSRIFQTRAMARLNDNASPVEIKAVDNAWPLAGSVALDPPIPLDDALADTPDGVPGAVVADALLQRLDAKIGDVVSLGPGRARINAVILREPDSIAGGFSFGPRALIRDDAAQRMNVVSPGSLFNTMYRLILHDGDSADALKNDFQSQFPNEGLRLRDWNAAAPQVRTAAQNTSLFFSLAGIAATLLGALAAASAARAHMHARRTSVAVLRALGATSAQTFTAYALQTCALAALGASIGVLFGASAPFILLLLADQLPLPFLPGPHPIPLISAGAVGFLAALGAAVPSLARGAGAQPGSLLRSRQAPPPQNAHLRADVASAALLALAAAAASFSSPRPLIAAGFLIGAAAFGVLLHNCGSLVRLIAKRFPDPHLFLFSHLRVNLSRRDGLASPVVLAVGAGVAALTAVSLSDVSVRRALLGALPQNSPSFFSIGVLARDAPDYNSFLSSINAHDVQQAPVLRARLTHVRGTPVEQLNVPPNAQWVVRSDRLISYAQNHPAPDEQPVVKGSWWPPNSDKPLVSMSSQEALALGIDVGDELQFNALGRPFSAHVASLRQVKWESFRLSFVFLFNPTSLKNAPFSVVFSGQTSPEQEISLLRGSSKQWPHVSVVSLRSALADARTLFSRFAFALQLAAFGAVIAGACALSAAFSGAHRARAQEASLLKALGASRRRILSLWIVEYSLLGAVGGALGAAAGSIGAAMACRFAFNIPFSFSLPAFLLPVMLAAALAPAAALLGALHALRKPPAELLRSA